MPNCIKGKDANGEFNTQKPQHGVNTILDTLQESSDDERHAKGETPNPELVRGVPPPGEEQRRQSLRDGVKTDESEALMEVKLQAGIT